MRHHRANTIDDGGDMNLDSSIYGRFPYCFVGRGPAIDDEVISSLIQYFGNRFCHFLVIDFGFVALNARRWRDGTVLSTDDDKRLLPTSLGSSREAGPVQRLIEDPRIDRAGRSWSRGLGLLLRGRQEDEHGERVGKGSCRWCELPFGVSK